MNIRNPYFDSGYWRASKQFIHRYNNFYSVNYNTAMYVVAKNKTWYIPFYIGNLPMMIKHVTI